MVPTLDRVAGPGKLALIPKVLGAEDFSFFQRVIPGLFVFIGVTPEGIDPEKAYSNHSPKFFADERGLEIGVRTLAHLACDFLESRAPVR
jgi:amidohydrolase